MKGIIQSLGKHLTSNNWWIHVTVLIAITFLYYMTFTLPFGQSLIYLNEYKWITFSKFLVRILVIYSPMIIYSIFRSRISKASLVWVKHIVWALIFMLYPLVFIFSEGSMFLDKVLIMPENLTLIGIALLIVEIFTNPKSTVSTTVDISTWKNKVSPEWIVIVLFLMLAVYGGLNLIIENEADNSRFKSGVWIGLQSVILLGSYYIFYLINHYFLVNRIYRYKGLVYYLFSFLALMIVFFIPLTLLYYYLPAFRPILSYKLGKDWVGPNAPTGFWSIHAFSVFFFMYLTIPLTILVQWIGMAKRVNSLEKEKTDTELNLLKQQINPHFFFNTLNNIYSMSRKKSEDTPEAILQLSDLMRYVIYKGQEETVSLSQEIKYIEDYIELQKLRLHQNFDYTFDIDIKDSESQVTPLLFIILVENAFKHGIEVASEDSYLHLNLNQNDNGITFTCSNSLEENNKNTDNGLGLTNLKRRLELSYPERHSLALTKSDSYYQAIMRIEL